MFSLIHTNDNIKSFGISFSILNFISDYATLMTYLFKRDIATTYIEVGKKFHANMSGEEAKIKFDYTDYKDKDSNVYLSPHSVSNTYLMFYMLCRNNKYLLLTTGSNFMEYRVKAYLLYKGYKFIIRSVFDVLNIDNGTIIELKTTSFYKSTLVEARNYDMQAYIYSIMSKEICKINQIYFVFVRTIYPFKEIIKKVSLEEIESGRIKFHQKLDLFIDILEQNNLYHLFSVDKK